MNTLQFAQRLGAHLKADDPANLPSAMLVDVLTAMNAGISRFYSEAPEIYKRTPLSFTLLPPATLDLTATAQYENTLTGTPFMASQLGCSVVIAGIVPHNEVAGPASLLDGWLSETLTAAATLYHDSLPLPYIIERLTSDVRLFSQESVQGFELVRDDGMRHRRLRTWNEIPIEPPPLLLGRPRRYMLDIVSGDRGEFGTNGTYLLRVEPKPQCACIVRFEALLAPKHLVFADLVNPVAVPVPPHRVEDILLPLCAGELTASRWWRDPATKKGVMDRAQDVVDRRLKQITPNLGAPHNAVGVPHGF